MPSSAPAMSATNPLNALDAIRQAGVIIASDTAEYDRQYPFPPLLPCPFPSIHSQPALHTHTEIAQFHPQDATSNPSLVFAALQKPQYNHLIDDAIDFALKRLAYGTLDERTQLALDYVVRTEFFYLSVSAIILVFLFLFFFFFFNFLHLSLSAFSLLPPPPPLLLYLPQLVQVSIHILDSIPGRVSVSVDPRLAYNYDAIISKVKYLPILVAPSRQNHPRRVFFCQFDGDRLSRFLVVSERKHTPSNAHSLTL